jgi:hypothetical protein
MLKTRLLTLGILTGTIGALTATATVIGPGGGPQPADVFGAQTGLTLLGSVTGNVNPVPGSSFNASYTEYVYRDNTAGVSPNGLGAGDLDFVIVLSNAGPGVVEHITSSLAPGYSGFITDVGYATSINGGATSTGVVPSNVDRSSDGAVIDFNYLASNNLASGQSTPYLEIQTNATSYVSIGTVSVQDGVSGFGNGFAPATPEPMSVGLLGGGLALLGIARWRRWAKKV